MKLLSLPLQRLSTMSANTANKPKITREEISLQKAQELEASSLRSLPNAVGPEKSILSSMLQDPANYIGLAEEKGLVRDIFYNPSHGELYDLIREMQDKNESVELVGLNQKLMDRGLLDKIGGTSYLTEIYSYSTTPAHFEHHLDIVKQKHILRSIISKCSEAINRAYEDQEEVASLLDEVEQNVFAIREGAEEETEASLQTNVQAVMEDLQQLILNGDQPLGIGTGYKILDSMSGGLKGGEMFVVAARPSMGKTSFMMNIVEDICLTQDLPTMVFSCEMTSKQIVQRLLFARARFEIVKLKTGKPSKDDLRRIKAAAEEVAASKLFIDDTAGISISELRAKARRKKKDEDIQLIAIDYLQLMRSTSKQAQNSREREIAEISAGLKGLAKELNVPILVLAQLNRGPESRTGGAPRMSDLRESGSIEQDADMVGLLYRSAYYADSEEERQEADGVAALNLAKNRNGATGEIPLTFIKGLMRFENSERRIED